MLGTGTQVIVFEPKWGRPLQEMSRKNRKQGLTAHTGGVSHVARVESNGLHQGVIETH